MRGRTNRLAITIVLTIADVAAGKFYCSVIWQVFAKGPIAKCALLGLLCLWTASVAVLWLHAAYDLRQILRGRDEQSTQRTAMIADGPERDSNV